MNTAHGNWMGIANTAVVGVRLTPCVITGSLSPDDEQAVFHWGSLNPAALLAYREGQIDTIQPGQLLKPLSSGQPDAPSVPREAAGVQAAVLMFEGIHHVYCRRAEQHDEQGRQDKDHHRDRQQGRQTCRLLFGAGHARGAHLGGEDAQ